MRYGTNKEVYIPVVDTQTKKLKVELKNIYKEYNFYIDTKRFLFSLAPFEDGRNIVTFKGSAIDLVSFYPIENDMFNLDIQKWNNSDKKLLAEARLSDVRS